MIFVVNVVRTLRVGRTIHLTGCRYARGSARSYTLDGHAVMRLVDRQHAGNGDKLTSLCKICRPGELAALVSDGI